jgi:hypothetical protein
MDLKFKPDSSGMKQGMTEWGCGCALCYAVAALGKGNSSMQAKKSGVVFALGAAALCSAGSAQAAVTISSAATANMSCSGGVCAPTAKNAVLNVGDLETLLASGSVTVTTTGTGVQANDIDIKSVLTWATSGTLSLVASDSIAVSNPVSIGGPGGLTIVTGKKGTFSFSKSGDISFANLSSGLVINGSNFTLVGDIKTLAADIAANPNGNFALAASYDASADGTYQASPIPTIFDGTFEGLGNTISNLAINGASNINGHLEEGLFAWIDAKGTVKDIGLLDAKIVDQIKLEQVGALAGDNVGFVGGAYVTGTLSFMGKSKDSMGGGLVGENDGTIAKSYSTALISGKKSIIGGLASLNDGVISECYATGGVSGFSVGGLVADNFGGTISGSYATGNVRVLKDRQYGIEGGGLVAENQAIISNSYSTGSVTSASDSVVGGLVGGNSGPISFSYSTGRVAGGVGSYVGGLIGYDGAQSGNIIDSYWDTDTSGITNLGDGAGNIANDPGITGLTTAQFQSGLPAGFDPTVWAEKSKIDEGFPYLLANKPAK